MAGNFSNDDVKKVAIGAAIGAVVAFPLPFIGPPMGAIFGAGFVAMRKLARDRRS